jgi:hypothetical protein
MGACKSIYEPVREIGSGSNLSLKGRVSILAFALRLCARRMFVLQNKDFTQRRKRAKIRKDFSRLSQHQLCSTTGNRSK